MIQAHPTVSKSTLEYGISQGKIRINLLASIGVYRGVSVTNDGPSDGPGKLAVNAK